MDKRVKNIYCRIRELHGDMVEELDILKAQMGDADHINNGEYHADNVYALREIKKYIDSLSKDVNKLNSTAQKLACLFCATQLKDDVRTEFVIGKPKMKRIIKAPSKRRYDPESFDKVMMALNIPEEAYLAELIRPHWPNVQQYFNSKLAQGENPPVNIDDTATVFEFEVRKRKEIDCE